MTGQLIVHRAALPATGGIWDQDAKTMRALEHLAAVTTAMWQERRTRDRQKAVRRRRG